MTLQEQLQYKIDNKTKPTGSLGRLEELAIKIGVIQNTLEPKISKPTILVFAADHGLSDEGISPYPKSVTYQMAMNHVAGGAAISVFSRNNGIVLKVIDAGVDHDFPKECGIIDRKIARGTKNMLHHPAMTIEECRLAMKGGSEQVIFEYKSGCNTIGFGEKGIGNTSASSLLMHTFTGMPIEECTGSGAGMLGDALIHKTRILKEVSIKHNPQTTMEKLATFGGLEIAMMVGAMLEAFNLEMVILIDGFIATAAILVAQQFIPEITNNCIFCHTSEERGHKELLKHLKADPILNLGMRLGEGSGVAVALPIIKSAVDFLTQMASFEEAGVDNKVEIKEKVLIG